SIDLPKGEARIEMEKHISMAALQMALQEYPKYQLSEINVVPKPVTLEDTETKSWFASYKPILLIFSYIFTVSIIASYSSGSLEIMKAMQIFMTGFFLTFSFFKMLNLNAFAESY